MNAELGHRSASPPPRVAAGFTLIELLVVVTLIVVLLSFMMSAMNTSLGAANLVICQNNLKQLSIAHFSYAADNNQAYNTCESYLTTTSYSVIPATSILVINNYLTVEVARKMFLCPSDTLQRNPGWGYINPPSVSYIRNVETQSQSQYMKFRRLAKPSQHALLLEEYELGPMNDAVFYANPWDLMTQRHYGNGCIGFYDGHSELIDSATFNGQTYEWRLKTYLDPLR